ncbi:MAG: hypothetical protein J6A28_04000 [Clostridia bacterium]|nr:hypothetical protein [Clostridia bacterium]
MGNVYGKISSLLKKQNEINRTVSEYIKEESRSEDIFKLCQEERGVISQLNSLARKYRISPCKMREILSQADGCEYRLKIFCETEIQNERQKYTKNFIACYLNDKNKFFDYDKNGIHSGLLIDNVEEWYVEYPLSKEEFKELKESLTSDNSYVLSSLHEFIEAPLAAPAAYMKHLNFTKIVVRQEKESLIGFDFYQQTQDKIKKALASIELTDENSADEEVSI